MTTSICGSEKQKCYINDSASYFLLHFEIYFTYLLLLFTTGMCLYDVVYMFCLSDLFTGMSDGVR